MTVGFWRISDPVQKLMTHRRDNFLLGPTYFDNILIIAKKSDFIFFRGRGICPQMGSAKIDDRPGAENPGSSAKIDDHTTLVWVPLPGHFDPKGGFSPSDSSAKIDDREFSPVQKLMTHPWIQCKS